MKITPEDAQLALNAIDAHYRSGMAGGANYGRLVTIFADKLQNFINEEVAKQNTPLADPDPPKLPPEKLPAKPLKK